MTYIGIKHWRSDIHGLASNQSNKCDSKALKTRDWQALTANSFDHKLHSDIGEFSLQTFHRLQIVDFILAITEFDGQQDWLLLLLFSKDFKVLGFLYPYQNQATALGSFFKQGLIDWCW